MGLSRGRWAAFALVAAAVAAGCGEEGKQAGDRGVNWDAPTARAPQPAALTGATPARPAAAELPPAPPSDARYTISCKVFNGDDHVAQSKIFRDNLLATSGLKKWYVVHDADHSTLFYGFYRTFDSHASGDAAEARRAHEEMDSVRLLATSNGFHPFSTALWVPIDAPDPTANPAWDLTRSKGYWSLEIAVFKGVPDRKERAVEAVKEARAQGIEAYYYHGDNASSVCIGSWPKEAAYEGAVASYDPTRPLIVTPGEVSDEFKEKAKDADVVTAKVEVEDPTMKDAMRTYTEHAYNGSVTQRADPNTGRAKPESSFLVKVPRRDPMADGGYATDARSAAPAAARPTGPADHTMGNLRGLD